MKIWEQSKGKHRALNSALIELQVEEAFMEVLFLKKSSFAFHYYLLYLGKILNTLFGWDHGDHGPRDLLERQLISRLYRSASLEKMAII